MTKNPPDPNRRSLLLDLLRGVTNFMEEVTDALSVPTEDEQRLVRVESEVSATQESVQAVEAEIDALHTAVEGIEGRQIKDTQTILETLEKLRKTQDLILDRVKALEEAGRIEEAGRWKALLMRVAKLILVLVGPVAIAQALRDAFVQEELYPWLKGLRERAKDVLDAPESPLPTPTPTVEPMTTEESRSEADLSWSGPLRFDWVTIPAGWFWMGSDPAKDQSAISWEEPYHKVYLHTFRIAKVPVTVPQFGEFVKATGYRTQAEQEDFAYTWRSPRGEGSDVGRKTQHPVTLVSWNDAQAFCQWAKVRLPSEAEWEKAARGTDGRIYPWGNELPTKDNERCNFSMNVGDTTYVDHYPRGASPYGVLDMAGNVAEWTSSLRKNYPYNPEDGREDLTAEGMRVARGGCFFNTQWLVRCANRYPAYYYAGSHLSDTGLRVCVSLGL